MYKVFINDKPLIFCESKLNLPDIRANEHYVFEKENQQKKVLISMDQSVALARHVILSKAPDLTFNGFFKDFQFIEAAGGVVQNQKDEILLIYRNGCWDLPKGKVEKGENISEAAIREVEEECGLVGPEITDELSSTYHTYERNGKKYLKRTHWYVMEYNKDHKLIPQIEEGITKVEWVNKSDLKIYTEKTYGSIKSIISDFLISD